MMYFLTSAADTANVNDPLRTVRIGGEPDCINSTVHLVTGTSDGIAEGFAGPTYSDNHVVESA